MTLDAPVGWGDFSKKRGREGFRQRKRTKSKLAQSFSAPGRQNSDAHGDQAAEEEDTPMALASNNDKDGRKQQRRRKDSDDDETDIINFKIVTRYRPILFADFIAPGEMVVVERPILDVLAGLPPAYFHAKYGKG